MVELAEGPWWWTALEAPDRQALRAGVPLRVDFRRAGEEYEAVPVFVLG